MEAKNESKSKPFIIIAILTLCVVAIVVAVVLTRTKDDGDKPGADSSGSSASSESGGTNDATQSGSSTSSGKYYTIKFVSEGMEMQTLSVKSGKIPEYTGQIPTKENPDDDEYEYVFDGWGTITEAKADKTYNAVFNKALVAPAWDGTVATSFDGGSGTFSDPYRIKDASQLAYLSQLVRLGEVQYNNSNVYYMLVGHINIGFQPWVPIGTGFDMNGLSSDNTVFKANFDGNGKKVINLSMTYLSESYYNSVGLFGKSYGNIKNIKIITCAVSMPEKSIYTGILCGYSDGKIENCIIKKSTLSGGGVSGAVAGFASYLDSCTVTNCQLTANTVCTMGGLCGTVSATAYTARATVKYCSFEGTVKTFRKTSDYYYEACGFIGNTFLSDISDSYAKVTLTSGSAFTRIDGVGVSISRCYTEGTISAGGTGFAEIWVTGTHSDNSINITDCYSDCDISFPSDSSIASSGFATVVYTVCPVNISRCLSYSNLTGKIFRSCGFLDAKTSGNSIDYITLSSCVAFGNVEAMANVASYSGGMLEYSTAYSFADNKGIARCSNCHRAQYQMFDSDKYIVRNGTEQSEATLNTQAFYTDILGLDASVWDFSELDVRNGGYPTLK